MSALPAMLADNPRLDLWVNFAAPGQVTISTGRVEIGQGVLTAMAQVAAEELDVAVERLSIRSGETDLTPNEGYTVGSQSMQMGGVALRQACADARGLFLDRGAQLLGRAERELTVRDGRILCDGKPTAHDYWSLAPSVVLATDATGTAPRKSVVGRDTARLDQPAKVFGQPVFIHDMKLDGTAHARVVRQPNRGAILASVDERAIRRAAREPIAFVRHGNFFGDRRRQRNGGGGCRRRGECSHDMEWGRIPCPAATGGELASAAAGDRPCHRRACRRGAVAGIADARGDLVPPASCPCVDRAVMRSRNL
jgi:nicotinate dehydrogenase subunit B